MKDFQRELDEFADCCRMQGYARSGNERQNHIDSALRAKARVLALYAEATQRPGEWCSITEHLRLRADADNLAASIAVWQERYGDAAEECDALRATLARVEKLAGEWADAPGLVWKEASVELRTALEGKS